MPKDADKNLPVAKRAEAAIPGVTYATMHVAVSALNSQSGSAKSDSSDDDSESGGGGGSKGKGGKKPGAGKGSGSEKGSGSSAASKPGY